MFHTPRLLIDDVTRTIAHDRTARFVDPMTSLEVDTKYIIAQQSELVGRRNEMKEL